LTLFDAYFRLKYSPASAARYLIKMVASATGNLFPTGKVDKNMWDDMKKYEIYRAEVQEKSTMKRHHPISHGTAQAILKRTCAIRLLIAPTGTLKVEKAKLPKLVIKKPLL
jgi:ribosomal protein L22